MEALVAEEVSVVLDRLAVGENTGNVVPSLKQVAQAYQKKISQQLSMFTKVIASGVLMAVFIFVGFIAFAIVSAVFQVSASFKMGDRGKFRVKFATGGGETGGSAGFVVGF